MVYQEYGLNLTKGQADKLQGAAKKGCPVTIRLSHTNLQGEHKMLLTTRQVEKITKLLQSLWWYDSGDKHYPIEENMQKEGGFLHMLAGLAMRALPMLSKTILPALGVGALSGLGGVAVNKALGSGFYLKRGGCVSCVKMRGKGLSLSPAKLPSTYGDGMYLKQGPRFYEGSGLILEANSPFKNIIGMLL